MILEQYCRLDRQHHVETDNSIEEKISVDEQRATVLKEIDRLETLARKEKQPKKKFELVQHITTLKAKL